MIWDTIKEVLSRTLSSKLVTLLKVYLFIGLIYMSMEVIFRAILGKMIGFQGCSYLSLMGFSSLWMIPIGSACIIISTIFHDYFNIPSWIKLFISMILVWSIEFLSGYFFNIKLGLHLWSYIGFPFNIMGQITFAYLPVWGLLIPLGWWLFDSVLFVEGFSKMRPQRLYQYYLDVISGK